GWPPARPPASSPAGTGAPAPNCAPAAPAWSSALSTLGYRADAWAKSLTQRQTNRNRGSSEIGQGGTPPRQPYTFFVFKNVPFSSSLKACRSSSCVFITMGPYQATGSSSGLPETSRKRMPSSPACTATSSPRSNRTSERLSASEGGAVSSQPTPSVGTASGPDALQNFPDPANT